MRLAHIKIDNFRGLSRVDIRLSRFGCLIGENNAGKSSVFQALNIFLRSAAVTEADFLNPARPVRIQLTFTEIHETDLQRLEESHRSRIEPEVSDGRLTLARTYAGPGKGSMWVAKKVPSDARFRKPALEEVLRPRISTEELEANVRGVYPEIFEKLSGKVTRVAVKREWAELVAALPEDAYSTGDDPLMTGLDKSVAPLLPEPIYIPAVKELNDDLKTTSSATFGRLLSLLFEDIEHQLPELEASFDQLRNQLNVVAEEDGSESDRRLPEVRQIETLIQQNLQESFPRASVRLEIPHPGCAACWRRPRSPSTMASVARSRPRETGCAGRWRSRSCVHTWTSKLHGLRSLTAPSSPACSCSKSRRSSSTHRRSVSFLKP